MGCLAFMASNSWRDFSVSPRDPGGSSGPASRTNTFAPPSVRHLAAMPPVAPDPTTIASYSTIFQSIFFPYRDPPKRAHGVGPKVLVASVWSAPWRWWWDFLAFSRLVELRNFFTHEFLSARLPLSINVRFFISPSGGVSAGVGP